MRSMLLFGLMCCILCSCGLSKYGIKEAWVFTEEKFRGNIQVDEHGTPVTKGVMVETTIFFETKTKEQPAWTTAEINGKTYKVNEVKLIPGPSTIGKNKSDEKPVTITAAEGNFLYRLALESFDPAEHTGTITGIRLKGTTAEGDASLRIKRTATALLPQMVP